MNIIHDFRSDTVTRPSRPIRMAMADAQVGDDVFGDDPTVQRLLALENTFAGRVLPLAYVSEATAPARRHGLGCHLDGARLFNAAVALGLPAAALAEPFDTVSVCLSKGLGAPVGSVLAGSTSLIKRARRVRKMLGGGMRQAEILAAAGIYALDHNVERLAEDHANARILASGLAAYPALDVTRPETNIVLVSVAAAVATDLAAHLAHHGIGISGSARLQRWVIHLDVDRAAVDQAVARVGSFFGERASSA